MFVVPNLLRDDRFLIQPLGNRFRGLRTGPRDIDAPPLTCQVAMRFRKRGQAIPCQDYAHPWGIALVHVVDAQRKDDRESVLVRACREAGMFGAARPFPCAEDSAEIGVIHRSAIGKRVQRAPCLPEIGDATRDDRSAQRACWLSRNLEQHFPRIHVHLLAVRHRDMLRGVGCRRGTAHLAEDA